MKWKANKELDNLKRYQGYRHDGAIVHRGCEGQIMVDAQVKKRIMQGFGDKGDGKFSVDFMVVTYWRGTCLKCKVDGLFQMPGGRKLTTRPASINRKLEVRGGK